MAFFLDLVLAPFEEEARPVVNGEGVGAVPGPGGGVLEEDGIGIVIAAVTCVLNEGAAGFNDHLLWKDSAPGSCRGVPDMDGIAAVGSAGDVDAEAAG